MQTLNNDARSCTNPRIIASKLTSIRNIHLRQELRTISNQIQEQYEERLPILDLVTIAAYEQVFLRQPLSLPEELRRDAVKYALKYYQLNIEKLRIAEAQNGLCPNHDRLSCFDRKCPLHQSNPSESNSQSSISSTITESEQNSDESSFKSDDDTNSDSASISSYNSSITSTSQRSLSSSSTFSDTPSLYSSTKSTSNRSMTTSRTDKSSTATRRLPPGQTPKIIISRPSDHSLTSSDTENASFDGQISARKQSMEVHRRSLQKRKSSKKSKKYKK